MIHWRAHDAVPSQTPPNPGDLLAFQHAVWRVIEVKAVPRDRWTEAQRSYYDAVKPEFKQAATPVVVVLRPVRIPEDDPRGDHDLHLSSRGARTSWDIYRDEHYPVCAHCGEPTPCRERLGMAEAAAALNHMARYELTGVCPACQTPVTGRQKSLTFPDNLEIPAGPPVTFHIGRAGCRGSAARYEQRWVAADPRRRRTTLSCPGHLTNHNDGTYDCTELNECRGPAAQHQAYSICGCPDCHARGRFSCHPQPDAQRNAG